MLSGAFTSMPRRRSEGVSERRHAVTRPEIIADIIGLVRASLSGRRRRRLMHQMKYRKSH